MNRESYAECTWCDRPVDRLFSGAGGSGHRKCLSDAKRRQADSIRRGETAPIKPGERAYTTQIRWGRAVKTREVEVVSYTADHAIIRDKDGRLSHVDRDSLMKKGVGE